MTLADKELLIKKYKDEQVLCIKNSHMGVLDTTDDSHVKVNALFNLMKYASHFDYRYDAEFDFTKKQVIPYVVLRHDDKYLVTKRIQGDSRLVGQMSIAVGGHINPCDTENSYDDPLNTVCNCILRELFEETTIAENEIGNTKFITTFIDESTQVSKVHVCLLTVVDALNKIDIKEIDKLEGHWMTIDEIESNYDNLESWSKIALELLKEHNK